MTKKAVCVGINDYPYDGNDLNGCVNDAKAWAGRTMSSSLRIPPTAPTSLILVAMSHCTTRSFAHMILRTTRWWMTNCENCLPIFPKASD